MANRWGNSGKSDRLFSWAPKSLQMVTAAMKLKDAYSLEEIPGGNSRQTSTSASLTSLKPLAQGTEP